VPFPGFYFIWAANDEARNQDVVKDEEKKPQ